MARRFFSNKKRPVHLGPYALEKLRRIDLEPDLSGVPVFRQLNFDRSETPRSIVNAMREYQAMMDAIRDGLVNKTHAQCPDDPSERANHIKAFGYFCDASMMGVAELSPFCALEQPYTNPDIGRLAEKLQTTQTKTLASGIDHIMADLKESMDLPSASICAHTHAIAILYEYPRDPTTDEAGSDWIDEAQAARASLRSAETASVLANYFRVLGYSARAHTATSSELDLNRLAIKAGLASLERGQIVNPYIGTRYGLAVVSTNFVMTPDKLLAPLADQPKSKAFGSMAANAPFAKRRFVDGEHPFETLKRQDDPTTFIDEARVARVPKRADMFARAQFGDMGKRLQDGARNGHYARKSAPGMAQRRTLGAFVLIQDGEAAATPHASTTNAKTNADNIKATAYFLGADAVGLSRCPDWAWYSHDAVGDKIIPTHDQAISIIIDQGYETMEGASGDDWISVAQSMRAYLRFSLLGGVLAQHIRNLGYSAKAHTVMDGEVLQPPLLLLSGLGEVSRIGEVILNPFLGPRLKSGVITTDMPMTHDKPIDFGLQKFCESCNKCARECPSGAITAGPKLMFNGYEIWKSDSQKCATYRITTPGGAMCGRCMKTCPWNLEGLFAEAPFRWAAMNLPGTAKLLAKLDDSLGNGALNPIKKWWWDLEIDESGAYLQTTNTVNQRELQKDLDLKYEDQTLAVYPAHLAPHPWPFPFPMDRESGIEAYQSMITANEYKSRLTAGTLGAKAHTYKIEGDAPVIRVEVSKVTPLTPLITKYELSSLNGEDLPPWTAGAHLDIVVAPEYLRQYSMSGNPADRTKYEIAVLVENDGRGGSKLMHRIFSAGRKIFVSKPINHFPVDETATKTFLFGGGIGITPMIAMAHRLHELDAEFEIHYSVKSTEDAGFLDEINGFPWKDRLQLHVSDQGSRADLSKILNGYQAGWHCYVCGPERFMSSVSEAAKNSGFPDENCHLEYFSVPELPDYENKPFSIHLTSSGKQLFVPADRSVADVLNENGYNIPVKCEDGICGVCHCSLVSGDVEHRDFVLS
ncbi:MAG: reductive dehalogenase, partial [Rhizobiales bacterium]|nr:reductive dehalogenase [Hyphomicrobiales bacterium]